MQVEAKKKYSHGFVITEADLRRLVDILLEQHAKLSAKSAATVTYKIKFKNGTIADTSSIDDILGQENVGSSQLIRLEVSVVSLVEQDKIFSNVGFINADSDEASDVTSIWFAIQGNSRDWVFVTSNLLEERVERIKRICPNQLFSGRESVARRLLVMMVMLILMAVMLLIPVRERTSDILAAAHESGSITDPIDALILIEQAKERPLGNMTDAVLIMLGILSFLAITGWFFTKYYPVYNFCWGDYVQEFQKKESARKFVLVVILLGLVISAVGGILANLTGITSIGS